MSTLDWEGCRNQIYECVRCGHRFKGEELIMRDRIVCPKCGFHVIKKIRPPVVKRRKAI